MHYQSQFPVSRWPGTGAKPGGHPTLDESSFSVATASCLLPPASCLAVTKIIYSTGAVAVAGSFARWLPCGSLSVKLFKRKPLRMLTLSFTFYLFCHLINFLPASQPSWLSSASSSWRTLRFAYQLLGRHILRWTPHNCLQLLLLLPVCANQSSSQLLPPTFGK